jgi:hypothetical protein
VFAVSRSRDVGLQGQVCQGRGRYFTIYCTRMATCDLLSTGGRRARLTLLYGCVIQSTPRLTSASRSQQPSRAHNLCRGAKQVRNSSLTCVISSSPRPRLRPRTSSNACRIPDVPILPRCGLRASTAQKEHPMRRDTWKEQTPPLYPPPRPPESRRRGSSLAAMYRHQPCAVDLNLHARLGSCWCCNASSPCTPARAL